MFVREISFSDMKVIKAEAIVSDDCMLEQRLRFSSYPLAVTEILTINWPTQHTGGTHLFISSIIICYYILKLFRHFYVKHSSRITLPFYFIIYSSICLLLI